MSKPIKDIVTKEINSRFGHLESILVVNPIGLNAKDSNKLRIDLRKKKIEMEVVKNSLAQRAFAGTKLELVAKLFEGSCALVTGGDSIVEVAREITGWLKKVPALKVRGAVVEGQLLDANGVQVLSKMPSRPELQGQIIMLAKSPGARIASQIAAPASKVAGCIKALVEKLEEKESGAQAAA
ncbi:MAG: 50S ribosomal protein L10 [Phycisphaerae bacterium]